MACEPEAGAGAARRHREAARPWRVVACTLLSGVALFLSTGLGTQWTLAWIAAVPLLWLAFGAGPGWRVFAAAFVANLLGQANLLPAYAGAMPWSMLGLYFAVQALLFAVAIAGARIAYRRLGATAGIVAFAALWAGGDFLVAFSPATGSILTPAAVQVGAPALVQSASLVGFSGVTFLIGAVSAGLAVALRERRLAPAVAVLMLFAANAGFGAWRMSLPAPGTMRVALVAADDVIGRFEEDDRESALRAIDAYAAQAARLRDAAPALIVLPENIARIAPAWQAEAQAPLAAAAEATGALVVAGFNARVADAQRVVAWAYPSGGGAPATYAKRRLVPGLETTKYAPGGGPMLLHVRGASAGDARVGLAICKDMDFQAMVRADVAATRPQLLAVPASDFGADGWSHARVAILRGVENGVAVARSARRGMLTVSDRHGRVVASTQSRAGFATLVADLPLHQARATVYGRGGDWFGWACLALGAALPVAAAFRHGRAMA